MNHMIDVASYWACACQRPLTSGTKALLVVNSFKLHSNASKQYMYTVHILTIQKLRAFKFSSRATILDKINESKRGKWCVFALRAVSSLIWGDGGLLFHFILSKIVATGLLDGFSIRRTMRRSLNHKVFWHQSEARTAATVWNWSGKTLSTGALLSVLYFSSCHYFPPV